MAVDGVLADHQPLRDLAVREPLGERQQHLPLPRRQLRKRRAARPARTAPSSSRCARSASSSAPSSRSRSNAAVASRSATSARPRREQGSGELDPRPRRLEWRAAALEAIDRVLEQRPSPLVLAARRRRAAPRRDRRRPAAARCRQPLDLAQRLERRAGLIQLAARRARVEPASSSAGSAVELAVGRHLPQEALDQARPPARPRRGRARGARGRAAPPATGPASSSRRAASRCRPCRRRSSASPTSGPPTIAGRDREKSSIDASSTASASCHRPRQRCTAPYSARQKASM